MTDDDQQKLADLRRQANRIYRLKYAADSDFRARKIAAQADYRRRQRDNK